MARIKYFVLTATAALVLAACAGNAPANNANTANTHRQDAGATV